MNFTYCWKPMRIPFPLAFWVTSNVAYNLQSDSQYWLSDMDCQILTVWYWQSALYRQNTDHPFWHLTLHQVCDAEHYSGIRHWVWGYNDGNWIFYSSRKCPFHRPWILSYNRSGILSYNRYGILSYNRYGILSKFWCVICSYKESYMF